LLGRKWSVKEKLYVYSGMTLSLTNHTFWCLVKSIPPPPPPCPWEPCYLHINIQRMGGYCPTAVEITSGSRTVEVYSDDEYLGTTRGTFTRKTE